MSDKGKQKASADEEKIEEDFDKKMEAENEGLQQMLAALQLKLAQRDQPAASAPAKKNTKEDHQFWNTQPVPDYNEDFEENGPYEPDKKPEEIRQTPYPLPAGYEWSEIDIDNVDELKELYTLLTLNYVEDEDAMFRFDYSPEFLKWALQPPNWRKLWCAGVRVSANKKLVGFISAIPADLRIYNHKQFMVEVNFLCVHKKLRSKRMAPVLIKEITRRVHITGTFQAAYTAGLKLPRPISSARYYHRSLNPKKLVETGFSHLSRNLTLARLIKLNKLPDKPETKGFRPMTEADVPKAFPLLTKYLERFSFAPIFIIEEFRHWLIPRESVVYSYVVEDPASKEITDFISFYSLPSTVINNPLHKTLYVAYLYYYASTKTPLATLMKDCLIVARDKNFDVFNCLQLMENKTILEELRFGAGDGELQYYLYNWKCKKMDPNQVGLVLL